MPGPAQTDLTIETHGPGLYEFTDALRSFVAEQAPVLGLLTVFVRHTSCSLLIQENADPDVQRDLQTFFEHLAPPTDAPGQEWITHRSEGPDDMPAHIKAALTPVSLSIPVRDSRLMLGTWQGVYLFEHRRAPMRRNVVAHLTA